MKTEEWNNHIIRFVQWNGEWVGISKDISNALGYRDAANMLRHVPSKYKGTQKVSTLGGIQSMSTLTEFGIYKAIFNSKKPEATEFQEWVFNIIKQLRESAGIEGFQVFRMMDKEHQKKMMSNLNQPLSKPCPRDFIKANTITNKAVSTLNGYPKMIKKGDMTPEMLLQREPILKDTVDLMSTKEKFDLDISVSKTIYRKIGQEV